MRDFFYMPKIHLQKSHDFQAKGFPLNEEEKFDILRWNALTHLGGFSPKRYKLAPGIY